MAEERIVMWKERVGGMEEKKGRKRDRERERKRGGREGNAWNGKEACNSNAPDIR
jgi:hypothetical protein